MLPRQVWCGNRAGREASVPFELVLNQKLSTGAEFLRWRVAFTRGELSQLQICLWGGTWQPWTARSCPWVSCQMKNLLPANHSLRLLAAGFPLSQIVQHSSRTANTTAEARMPRRMISVICPVIVRSCWEFVAATPGGSRRYPYRVNC